MTGIYVMALSMLMVVCVAIYFLARKKETSTLTFVILYCLMFGLLVGIFSVRIHQTNEDNVLKEKMIEQIEEGNDEGKELMVEIEGKVYIVETQKGSSGEIKVVNYEIMD